MAECAEIKSKEKILDAAEGAFADAGFEGASLRSIVQSAGVNLATVYYYFGSKEGLLQAVFKRIFDPIKQEQLNRLQQLKAESSGQPIMLEKILEAMLAPAMCFSEKRSIRNEVATQLIGRMLTDPTIKTQELLRCQHEEVHLSYHEALSQALPGLPTETLQWRMELIWGAMAFVLCNPGRFEKKTNGVCGSIAANLIPQMIACFSAGFRAPGVEIR